MDDVHSAEMDDPMALAMKPSSSSSSLDTASDDEANSAADSNSQNSEDANINYRDDVPSAVIEEQLFQAVSESDRFTVKELLQSHRPSQVLQVLLTFSHPNRQQISSETAGSKSNITSSNRESRSGSMSLNDSQNAKSSKSLSLPKSYLSISSGPLPYRFAYFNHDPDVLQDAHELLGVSVSPLNFVQIACINGEEELAGDLVEFVYKHTHSKCKKLLLMEFLGKTWGDGNTTLHLASFQGMSDLVQRLIDYGANINKRNGRGYKPVDCADDDLTRGLFRKINQVVRLPQLSSEEQGRRTHGPRVNRETIMKDVASLRHSTESLFNDKQSKAYYEKGVSKAQIPHSQSFDFRPPTEVNASLAMTSSTSIQLGAASKVTKKKFRVSWDSNTLLLDYAKNGELAKVKELFEDIVNDEKADINFHSAATGLTPLHMACAYGHLDVVRYLIEVQHADTAVRDSEGWSVLHSIIAEIPDPIISHGNKKAKEQKDRDRFLAVLRYLTALPQIDLTMVTNETENILDVIKEPEELGSIDAEVEGIVRKSLEQRQIVLQKSATNLDTKTLECENQDGNKEDTDLKDVHHSLERTKLSADIPRQVDSMVNCNESLSNDKLQSRKITEVSQTRTLVEDAPDLASIMAQHQAEVLTKSIPAEYSKVIENYFLDSTQTSTDTNRIDSEPGSRSSTLQKSSLSTVCRTRDASSTSYSSISTSNDMNLKGLGGRIHVGPTLPVRSQTSPAMTLSPTRVSLSSSASKTKISGSFTKNTLKQTYGGPKQSIFSVPPKLGLSSPATSTSSLNFEKNSSNGVKPS